MLRDDVFSLKVKSFNRIIIAIIENNNSNFDIYLVVGPKLSHDLYLEVCRAEVSRH